MRNLLLISVAAALSISGAAAPYTGKVFVDRNGNGLYDKGEKQLEGVSVSDGLNVVKTDKAGAYELPGNPDGRFLFVTLPSGYRAEQFYRRVEEGRTAYDFGLMRFEPTERQG